MVEVFVVGNERSNKTNSWLHMTDSEAEAKRLAGEIKGGVYKKVPPKNLRPRRRKKK